MPTCQERRRNERRERDRSTLPRRGRPPLRIRVPERRCSFAQYDHVVVYGPVDEFHPAIEGANAVIGDADPDDVLYLACAIASVAVIRGDDSDFDE